MGRETAGELIALTGLGLAGYGVWLWLGPGPLLGYAGAVLVVFGVMLAMTDDRGAQDD
jgi:hypothetical protein